MQQDCLDQKFISLMIQLSCTAYRIGTVDKNPQPDQTKGDSVVPAKRLPIDKHAKGKSDRRGNILKNADS